MSAPGRPKGDFRSAPHEGTPVSAPADNTAPRRAFGWLALLFFALFAANLAVGKLSVLNHWGLPRVPGVAEFLVLFLATGCFVAFAAFSHVPGPDDPPD